MVARTVVLLLLLVRADCWTLRPPTGLSPFLLPGSFVKPQAAFHSSKVGLLGSPTVGLSELRKSKNNLKGLQASAGDDEEVSIGWNRKKEGEILAPGAYPCIPTWPARVVVPGQRRQLHLYDMSNLEVIRQACTSRKGYFCHVVQDPEAMEKRQFKLFDIGTEIKVLSSTPSTHENKHGEKSNSLLVDVIGVRRVLVKSVPQREPFVAVEIEKIPSTTMVDEIRKQLLDDTFKACSELRTELGIEDQTVSQMKESGYLPFTQILGPGESAPTVSGDLTKMVEQVKFVLERDGESMEPEDESLLMALAALQGVDPETKMQAMIQIEDEDLVRMACDGLEETRKKLIAMKTLKFMTRE